MYNCLNIIYYLTRTPPLKRYIRVDIIFSFLAVFTCFSSVFVNQINHCFFNVFE